MPTATHHCRTLLSAIIPGRRDLLDKALRHLTVAHFPDPTLRNIFVMLERYADATGAVMTRDALSDIIRSSDAGKVALYQETFDALEATTVEDSEFRWSVQQVRELAAERATGEALTHGLEILTRGVTDGRQEYKGHIDARSQIMQMFAEIERDLQMQDAPEGNVRHEGQDMLADYAERQRLRTSGRGQGVMFGIADLDLRVGGLQPGELDLVVAYSSEGKTTLCVQTAWSCAVEQGLNAVIMTSETLRPQVRRKILARHSMRPEFELLPDGLNTRNLKSGNLSEQEEHKMQAVVDDFVHNLAYGNLYVAQVPRGATIGTLEAKLQRIGRMWHVDLCVIDYLALLKPDRRRPDTRNELSEIVKDAKIMAATFDDGNGVCVLSPWQVNRASYDEALRTGYYTTKSLSETAEATNSGDVIVSLLGQPDNEDRRAELKGQVLKNRDGEKVSNLMLDVDYATCMVTSKHRTEAMAGLLDEF